jgi:Leucine Rich repeat
MFSFWHATTPPPQDALAALAQTESLYIDGSHWQDPVRYEAASVLLQAMQTNANVKNLLLSKADLDATMQTRLDALLVRNTTLQSVSLRKVAGQQGDYSLPRGGFADNHVIKKLSLMSCQIDVHGASVLSDLVTNKPSFTSLYLTSVEFATESFFASLAVSTFLQSLTLQNSQMSESAFEQFMKALAVNKSITSLKFDSMSLTLDQMHQVAHALKHNNTLQEISLRNSQVTADHIAILFSEGLRYNTTLQRLYLSRNPIGPCGAAALVDGLKQTTSLRELCLFDTKLEQEGCAILARGLAQIQGLHKIVLDGNPVETCANLYLEAAQANCDLHYLLDHPRRLVASNPIWKEIQFVLKANKHGRRILREESAPLAPALAKASSQPDVLFYLLQSMPARLPAGRNVFNVDPQKASAASLVRRSIRLSNGHLLQVRSFAPSA